MTTALFENSTAFAGFSVDDVDAASRFYRDTLGLTVSEPVQPGVVFIDLPGGARVLAYEKADHVPATFTVLNFPVTDLEAAVAELARRGATFERYEGTQMETDERGIFRGGGPLIAWFTDPAGNVISVMEDA
ncbi:VOC family protein [Georgenia satyanarayanai]|uniref:VOC family protein n=1 Tax=Georgenia satyanarayanai TaxID=860221 RepID=UPI00203F1DAA|nr:VOC family protein [Georgenia satyanarayanai]MCM3659401.1 VOC family protein [Georgenia satyanarayanai]